MPIVITKDPAPPLLSPLVSSIYSSPQGNGWVVASPEGVIQVELPSSDISPLQPHPPTERTDETPPTIHNQDPDIQAAARTTANNHRRLAMTWLEAFFDTPRNTQPRPKLKLLGTPFQRSVWRAIANIPCGQTSTYGELAIAIGRPNSARAVGAACGANPIPLIIPCHRVVGSDGSLTGFGGGLEQKRWLLEHEGAL